ncbi:P16 [Pseudomonas phage phi2954]|uniref:p16 n=1 Tax=Pseudomonas phage phi2954 TaxID=593131 RepID=C0KIU1_9VIRU|nr:P16 [Pseudomonas phage phi2954]ACM91126.1 P16 [Pseudomonas phage phi2954]
MAHARISTSTRPTFSRSLDVAHQSSGFHDRLFVAGVRMWNHEHTSMQRALRRLHLASSRVINFSVFLLLGSGAGTLLM